MIEIFLKNKHMKKILMAFGLTMFLLNAQAQNFQIGIKAGANLTKVTGKSFNEEFDLGYQAGFWSDIKLSKDFGIQPEVLFTQSGTTRSSGFASIYNTLLAPGAVNNIKLNYLTIPLLLRYSVTKNLALHVGPQYNILMDNGQTLLQNGQSAFKSGDFSMVAGIKLKLLILNVYGRYNIGLTNINDIDNKDKWTSQQLQIGLNFNL